MEPCNGTAADVWPHEVTNILLGSGTQLNIHQFTPDAAQGGGAKH